MGTNVFSGVPRPTPADEKAHRSVVIRAPNKLQNDEAATLAPRAHTATKARSRSRHGALSSPSSLVRKLLQGIGVSASRRAADDTDPSFRILESYPMVIHHEEFTAFVKFGPRDIPPHPDISRRVLRRLRKFDDPDVPVPNAPAACAASAPVSSYTVWPIRMCDFSSQQIDLDLAD